jgi:hypothetical protein
LVALRRIFDLALIGHPVGEVGDELAVHPVSDVVGMARASCLDTVIISDAPPDDTLR